MLDQSSNERRAGMGVLLRRRAASKEWDTDVFCAIDGKGEESRGQGRTGKHHVVFREEMSASVGGGCVKELSILIQII